MRNCIFTAHCTEPFCDRSCPTFVETTYLLERNGINLNNSVFQAEDASVLKSLNVLAKFQGSFGALKCEDTLKWADLLTYCAICQNWKGSQLHCTVFNLRYAKYLDELKKSWSGPTPDSLEMTQIWMQTAKILIVSNLDYVNFGDFESQTLLNTIQLRAAENLTTIVVVPSLGIVTKPGGLNSFPILLKKKIDSSLYKESKIGGIQS